MRDQARIAAAELTNGRPASVAPVAKVGRGTTPVKLLLAIGVRVYREALRQRLGDEPGIELVAVASDVRGIVGQTREAKPHVVLVDTATVDCPGTIRAILAAAPGTKVVAFGVTDNERDVIAFAEAGVTGYIGREQSFDDVLAAVHTASRGEVFCSSRVAATLVGRIATISAEQREGCPSTRLTAREHEIAELIDLGLTNRQIAVRLCIETATVKNHVHNILEKLQVHRRDEVAARVRGAGAI